MTLKFSTTMRNNMLDSFETSIGTIPRLLIYTGGSPANLSDGATGTLLINMLLDSDYMNDAAAGSKTKKGTWTSNAVDTGIAGYFRIISSGSVAHVQGSVSGSAGAGDMILDNTNITVSQSTTINTFTLNMGNA